nr:DUF5723 family protein [Pedobacter panaciterrae]
MRKYLILFSFLFLFNQLKAQQYGLFNTKTLFDGFENPAQKSFVLDSSRQYASNFFLPYFGLNAINKGNENIMHTLISTGKLSVKDIPIGTNKLNSIYQNSNVYLFNFKIFKSYKYHKELGFSWQLRTDLHAKYTNESLAIIDDYTRFNNSNLTVNPFNNSGYAQSYHQFSVTYRENYTKKLAFGIKLSLLSGISYSNLKINNSAIESEPGDKIALSLKGTYKSSFLEAKNLETNDLIPTFKNPGLALSFGTTYTAKNGVFIMANIKDLGIIRWSGSSYVSNFDNRADPTIIPEDEDPTLPPLTPKEKDQRTKNQITDIVKNSAVNKSFYTLTNAKADFLISKTYSFYTPSFIVSKNLFYNGGDVALVNKFQYSDFSISAIPIYDFNNLFLFGMQGMYQTPNFEFFMGSDNLMKTARTAYAAIKTNTSSRSGYNGASFYMGLGIKFGYTVEHPQNSSYIPGLDDQETGFFKRIFSIFSKKR